MDLDKIWVKIRPRQDWEAIDLGFAMGRQWFLPLWRIWLLTALPVCLAIVVLTQWLQLPFWLTAVLIWWFKPLYEPAMVFWMSRALFDERLSLGQVAGNWKIQVRSQLISNLTWRRLTPNRSFLMPVTVLEGLAHRKPAARMEVLAKNQRGGFWLTVGGIHFETILQTSFLILLLILVPEELRWFEIKEVLITDDSFTSWLGAVCGFFAMSIIAPFYVAGGFGLYLTRRTELEAWDIELACRRLLARRATRRRGASRGLASTLLVMVLLSPFQPFKQAEAAEVSRASARQAIDEVLAHKRFGEKISETYWHQIGDDQNQSTDKGWLNRLFDFLFSGDWSTLGTVTEAFIWILVSAVVVLIAYKLATMKGLLGYRETSRVKKRVTPVELFGLEISPESLPDRIAVEAQRLLADGQVRAALSLLYRGTLAKLVNERFIDIPDSATEGECLSLVSAGCEPDESRLFTRLTRAWLLVAYGHRSPSSEDVERLILTWDGVYPDNEPE